MLHLALWAKNLVLVAHLEPESGNDTIAIMVELVLVPDDKIACFSFSKLAGGCL